MRRSRCWLMVLAVTLGSVLVFGACDGSVDDDDDDHGSGDDDTGQDDDTGLDDDDSAADDDDDTTGDDDTAPPGPCPGEMELIEHGGDRYCIDRYEAHCDEDLGGGATAPWSPYESVDGVDVIARSTDGAVPQGYIDGDEAAGACLRANKRLCSSDEWLLACRGPAGNTWPYGDDLGQQPGWCNDDYPSHPVVDYYGTSDAWVWTYEAMNDPGINQQPGTLAASGDHPDCVSDFGVFDMVGNLHEWVVDADGTFRGGFYVDVLINGPGCTYATTAHTRTYHDYSTGFRCCRDADE